ncbi:MAG: dienelactone hydrolase family protein [Deltaproteobacteria bacterium]|nr:dienelactone hydrolase family protein [Deltaproteobacteria bacterium]
MEDWLSNAYGGLSRRDFLATIGTVGAGLAGFALAATPVAGQVVSTLAGGLVIKESQALAGDFQVPLYEAYPEAAGKYPAILIIPEVFGLHEHIRDITRRFALEGYLSISFEPYAREGGVWQLTDIAAVRKVVDPIPDERVMSDLDAILDYVKKHPRAKADRIGLTGFCRGGMYTLLYAARGRDIKAAVPWYGQIKPALTPVVRSFGPLDVAAKINAPVLGLYGAEDAGIPAADVREMEAALKAAGKTAEFVIYPGAPHAFFADYRPSYRPEAAKDAWARCLSWFKKHLEA